MKVGYAEQKITPNHDRPIFLAGFSQNRRATGVHDDLFAKAIAISDGRKTIVLCALDLIGFFHNHIVEINNRIQGIKPGTEVIIASTHTHHGPDTMGIYGPDDKTSGVDNGYLKDLKETIVVTIEESIKLDLVIESIKIGSVLVPGLVKNARDKEILDDELSIIQFLDSQRYPAMTIANFPCHPEVLFDENTQITSDYPGFLRRSIESSTGAPCLFFSGALGGMLTPDVEKHSFEEAKAMGRKLAETGLAMLERLEPISNFEISRKKQIFSTKLKNILFKIAIYRGLLPEPRDSKGVVTTETNLVKIGDCWMVTVPGELLPKLGLEIKAMLKHAGAAVAVIIGLGNDELGYILPRGDFRYPLNLFRPGRHYEETMSISRQIGAKLMDAVKALLQE